MKVFLWIGLELHEAVFNALHDQHLYVGKANFHLNLKKVYAQSINPLSPFVIFMFLQPLDMNTELVSW